MASFAPVRFGAVSLLTIFTLVLWSGPEAHAAEATAPSGVEAWYHVTPQEAPGLPPANPYPEETLHVGITAGVENARTYITLDLAPVPDGAEITGGLLTLPVDPAGGTIQTETARIEVCFVPDPPDAVQGSTDPPPELDCSTRAEATYVPEPEPHFTVDLGPFAAITGPFTSGLRGGGLALQPSPSARSETDSWHVALYGKDNGTEGARPITARLSYEPPAAVAGPGPGFGDPGSPGIGFGGSTPQVESPLAIFDSRPQPVEEPVVADADAGVTEAAAFEDIGSPYLSWVLMVPLMLLLFVGYFGRALTFEQEIF